MFKVFSVQEKLNVVPYFTFIKEVYCFIGFVEMNRIVITVIELGNGM